MFLTNLQLWSKRLTKKLQVIIHASIVTKRVIGQKIAKSLQKEAEIQDLEDIVEDLLVIILTKEAEVEKEAEIGMIEENQEETTEIEAEREMTDVMREEMIEGKTEEIEAATEEAEIERMREDPERDLPRTKRTYPPFCLFHQVTVKN